MNILGPSGSISPDAVAYAAFTGVSTGINEQQMALAVMQGRIARLPNNGDLSIAFGTDVRRETGEITPDALIATGDTTGNIVPPFQGSTTVLESFAELSLVAARDRNGLERFELDLAARAFRHDTSASGVAWNARALLRPVPGIALRATTARAFHAPTPVDLFRSSTDTFPLGRDPCDNFGQVLSPSAREQCARQGVPANADFGTLQQRLVQGGNPDLDAETAKVVTAGVVVEPFGARGLSLSVDFWRIDLTQAIEQPTLAVIFNNCYERGIQAFCDQVHRNPNLSFAIDFVDGATSNFGGTATSGVDAAVDLQHRIPGGGQLRARVDAQRLFKFDVDNTVQVRQGLGNYDLGVYPNLKANLSASLQHPSGAGAGFNLRFIDGFLECENNDCNGGARSRDVPAWRKVDVFSNFAFGPSSGGTVLTMGVNNVFDEPPPTIYVGFQGDSDAATYDYLGRLFYARLTQRF